MGHCIGCPRCRAKNPLCDDSLDEGTLTCDDCGYRATECKSCADLEAIRSMDWREIEERRPELGTTLLVEYPVTDGGVYTCECGAGGGFEFYSDEESTQAARAAALVYEFFKNE